MRSIYRSDLNQVGDPRRGSRRGGWGARSDAYRRGCRWRDRRIIGALPQAGVSKEDAEVRQGEARAGVRSDLRDNCETRHRAFFGRRHA